MLIQCPDEMNNLYTVHLLKWKFCHLLIGSLPNFTSFLLLYQSHLKGKASRMLIIVNYSTTEYYFFGIYVLAKLSCCHWCTVPFQEVLACHTNPMRIISWLQPLTIAPPGNKQQQILTACCLYSQIGNDNGKTFQYVSTHREAKKESHTMVNLQLTPAIAEKITISSPFIPPSSQLSDLDWIPPTAVAINFF